MEHTASRGACPGSGQREGLRSVSGGLYPPPRVPPVLPKAWPRCWRVQPRASGPPALAAGAEGCGRGRGQSPLCLDRALLWVWGPPVPGLDGLSPRSPTSWAAGSPLS